MTRNRLSTSPARAIQDCVSLASHRSSQIREPVASLYGNQQSQQRKYHGQHVHTRFRSFSDEEAFVHRAIQVQKTEAQVVVIGIRVAPELLKSDRNKAVLVRQVHD